MDTVGIRAPGHCFWAPKKVFPWEFAIWNIAWAPGDALGCAGEEMGFDFVAAGPMVRTTAHSRTLSPESVLESNDPAEA